MGQRHELEFPFLCRALALAGGVAVRDGCKTPRRQNRAAAARAAGMKAVHVRSPRDVERAVEPWLLRR